MKTHNIDGLLFIEIGRITEDLAYDMETVFFAAGMGDDRMEAVTELSIDLSKMEWARPAIINDLVDVMLEPQHENVSAHDKRCCSGDGEAYLGCEYTYLIVAVRPT